jgi:hypothetical protein
VRAHDSPRSDLPPSGAQSSIDLTDAAAKGRPFSLRKPWVASSAEIARSDMRPPFGFCRCSRFARATSSGLRSAWLLRPGGLYYELIDDPRFANEFGDAFQTYVGDVIERACPNPKKQRVAEQECNVGKLRKSG